MFSSTFTIKGQIHNFSSIKTDSHVRMWTLTQVLLAVITSLVNTTHMLSLCAPNGQDLHSSFCVKAKSEHLETTSHHAPCPVIKYSVVWDTILVAYWLKRPPRIFRRHAESPNERRHIDELNLFISYLPSLWLLVMWTKSSRLLAGCQTAVLQLGLSATEGDKSPTLRILSEKSGWSEVTGTLQAE